MLTDASVLASVNKNKLVTPEHIHAFDAYVSELAGMMNDHNGDTAA